MEEVIALAVYPYVAVYDSLGDVMYINDGHPRPADTDMDDYGFLWRYDFNNRSLIGITIEDFSLCWSKAVPRLADHLKTHLSAEYNHIYRMAEQMVRLSIVER